MGRAGWSDPQVKPDCQAEGAQTTHSLGTSARLCAAEGGSVQCLEMADHRGVRPRWPLVPRRSAACASRRHSCDCSRRLTQAPE
eukprot:3330707-Pyramimonas_sp.AAC.1